MCDILINVLSDCIFVLLITVIVFLLRLLFHRRLREAQRFFGFSRQMPIKIYVSGFEHSGVKTKRVVTALEYEAAVTIRYTLQHLLEGGILHRVTDFLAGLIGRELRFHEPNIEVSPLEEVNTAPYEGSMILIGGPVSNQVSKFYLQGPPPYVEPASDVAVIEKRIVGEQSVVLVYGYGEEQTQRAAQYLIRRWYELYTRYKTEEFKHTHRQPS